MLREEDLRNRHYEKMRLDVAQDPSDLQRWINEMEARSIIVPSLRDKQATDDLCPADLNRPGFPGGSNP